MPILVIAGKRLMLFVFVVNDPRILPIVTRTLKEKHKLREGVLKPSQPCTQTRVI
jgi:hypothetical protein